MIDEQDNIAKLQEKLNELIKKQEYFKTEMDGLQKEIFYLQSQQSLRKAEITLPEQPAEQLVMVEKHEDKMQEVQEIPSPEEEQIPDFRVRLEKFIGENLINKIGIVITVIGVGIGAKYAIDHQLISPLTRIILGYLLGLGLLGFAIRLRKKYENFSAVLLSGSMAIMYFITFAAYSFYALIPVALLLLVISFLYTKYKKLIFEDIE